MLHCKSHLGLGDACPLREAVSASFVLLALQGAIGTNWSTGSSVWTWGRTSSLWGWRSPGTDCPGRFWSLLLWMYSRPAWTRSCAACCRWPCSGRRVGLGDPQRSLPTPTILWFCDSVILWLDAGVNISDIHLEYFQYSNKRLVSSFPTAFKFLCCKATATPVFPMNQYRAQMKKKKQFLVPCKDSLANTCVQRCSSEFRFPRSSVPILL